MEQFTKQMKLAYKVLKQLQKLIRESIEHEEPYTSEQHLQDLIDEFEVYFQQAYYDVEAEKDMKWRDKLACKDEIIKSLHIKVEKLSTGEALTFADIDAAKAKIKMRGDCYASPKEVVLEIIKRYEESK
jgi:hypothetical protein